MATQITVPTLGESVTEATVASWYKNVGDTVTADEPVVELETDKVTVEVNAPAGGTLQEIACPADTTVEVGAVLGSVDETGAGAAPTAEGAGGEAAPAAGAPAAAGEPAASPAARKLMEEYGLDAGRVTPTGKDGRITKDDVLKAAGSTAAPEKSAEQPAEEPAARPAGEAAGRPAEEPAAAQPARETGPREERVRMTRLRQRIAERLKSAQDTAAMLSTFNEVDMTNLLALRQRYRDTFEKKHDVRLGIMSFFVKAVVQALKEFPAVNAEIDGQDIVYKNYYDIGIAVGTEQGLVVPVVRDCDNRSFADIEKAINDYGRRARDGKLSMEELTGGTFTITNGGVYGSLLSTPIINPPQSAIMGMHKTQQRPMVMEDGRIEARPMMYLAVSYDHRIIDGKEAVSFLVRVKENVEDPSRLVLDV